MMRKKLQTTAIAALLPLALALAMVTVSCPNDDVGGGSGSDEKTAVEGKWESSVDQTITFSGNSFTRITGSTDYKGTFSLNSSTKTINFTVTHISTPTGWVNISSLPTVLPETGAYNLLLDGKQLVIIYAAGAGGGTVVYQKAGTSTVSTVLVGKWVIESAPATVELDFSAYQLRRRTSGSSYTTYYTKETNKKIEIGAEPGEFTQDFCTSYTITGNTLTFTGGQSETWYPSVNFIKYVFPPYTPTPLTADQWADGVIAGGSAGEAWYSFNVTSGNTYRVWWNDNSSYNGGNNTKSLDVSVSGYYSDGTSITNFTNVDTAWIAARSFVADSNGTVYLSVIPATSGNIGTFGIVYSAGTEKPAVTFNPPAAPLTANQWEDGEITAGSAGEVWYSFAVANGTTYNVWWNDSSNSSGNRLITLDVRVSAFYSDGTAVASFSNTDDAWSTPKSFSSTLDATVYLRVTPRNSSSAGTFGIVYSTANTRPDMTIGPPSKTALTADQWANGSITAPSDSEVWYSFDVTNGTTYRVWWNESGANGNGLFKTLDVKVSAWYSGSGDNIFYDIDAGWTTAQSIAPTADGTVYLRVTPAVAGNAGTFGIVYSATATRPNVPFAPPEPPNPIALTNGQWENGEFTSSNREDWYSFDVTSGTYYFWLNDSGYYSGDGWSKTLPSARIDAWYSDGTSALTNVSQAWNTAVSINPPSNTTVYVRVTPYNTATGTYGIVYSSANTRPFEVPSNAIELTAGQWEDGEIPNGSDNFVWYSFPVTSGTLYCLWWNQAVGGYGDGSKTLGVSVSAYYSNGTVVSSGGDGWATARSFNATSADTVYVLVRPSSSNGTGTFGVVYNATTSTKPPNPSGAIPLTDGQWMNGEITNEKREVWYSVTGVGGTGNFFVWWNDSASGDNSKTLDVKVSGYTSTGSSFPNFTNVNNGWFSYVQGYAAQGDSAYFKVTPNYSSDRGTFGIVFSSTSTTRPTVP